MHADRKNNGKPQLSLLPKTGLIEIAKVLEMGTKKYGRNNWKKLWGDETVTVCLDSALRHMMEISDGNMRDEESGELHAAHVCCNMLFLLEYLVKLEKPSDKKDL